MGRPCSAPSCERCTASCGNSSFGADASIMRILRRWIGVDIRASTVLKEERERDARHRAAISHGGTESVSQLDYISCAMML